ncbi:MAG TPA: septation protein SpoVG family protein [Candidatus Mcinerneyibacteriales bacterium]|jgi:DNA-binding cell septation regulator SpoVG|nr:septation protein SpoVG family protein [Candidatus Mcinerneyibacteriota bacterium]HOO60429.1 septation protein SpoVG family protein [Candidatus Mcinerneyibacteriales bacterium]HPE19953.1 septation protein SpoVG family protein [Candidatus Mcinerneyibacteriales bacterium]HPJ70391.1 septation protein SpoVG family protein [Candidatus Mcinerneyibacteriales bacterium]HPQ89392.1 septation protein SpoVG family protein [Candidatus Mcinerneyibacteriales bacterium]
MTQILFWILLPVTAGLLFYIHQLRKKISLCSEKKKTLRADQADIVVTKTLDNGNIKAFVTVKISDTVLLKDIRILNDGEKNEEKLRIEVPVRITKKGHMMDIYQFIDNDFKEKLFDSIMRKFKSL